MKPLLTLAALTLGILLAAALVSSRLRDEAPPAAEPPQPVTTNLRWVGCDICKASFMDAAAAAFTERTGMTVEVHQAGATRGIREVAAGTADMGGCCRSCLNIPEEQGVKLVPVAWDALVVIVHPSNPVTNITQAQLRAVYKGEITTWRDLGGRDEELQVFARRGKHSGVGSGVRLLLFQDLDADFTPRARLFRSSGPLEEELEKTPHAIAFTGISSARLREQAGRLKMLAVEGRAPTRENVVAGHYLFYRPLYLTVPHRPSPAVQQFVEFLFSEEGQQIIRASETITLAEGKHLWGTFKVQMQKAVAGCRTAQLTPPEAP